MRMVPTPIRLRHRTYYPWAKTLEASVFGRLKLGQAMEREAFSQNLADRRADRIDRDDWKAEENLRFYRRLQRPVVVPAGIARSRSRPFRIRRATSRIIGRRQRRPLWRISQPSLATSGIKNTGSTTARPAWPGVAKRLHDASVDACRATDGKGARSSDRVESLICREKTMWASSDKTGPKPEQKAITAET